MLSFSGLSSVINAFDLDITDTRRIYRGKRREDGIIAVILKRPFLSVVIADDDSSVAAEVVE